MAKEQEETQGATHAVEDLANEPAERGALKILAVIFLLVLVLTGFSAAVSSGLLALLPGPIEVRDPATLPSPAAFKGPLLEGEEGEALRIVRAREREALDGYGWTDPQKTHARVPIRVAMKLIATSTRGGTR